MRAEIKVLGPLEVLVDGTSVVPSATKPRQLLAMLALNAGHVVTRASMIDELWADNAPRSAPSTLQTYVLDIRRHIRGALPDDQRHLARELVATRHTGYVLDVDYDAVDVSRYSRLAAAGRAAGAAGDYVEAERLLSEALAVWRGPVLVDIEAGINMEIETMRLAESRLSDLTLRIDAQLYLGRHQQLLGELAALCARHPYMENFHAQYMLALCRSGRPGQALQAYYEMWGTVRDHLGVDPSSRLRRLHRALLVGDAILDDPRYMVNNWAPDALAG
jgi:SARP family transcriptional regulator, regulator of embCAB operon